ncbi:MAG: DUF4043 family protein [Neisseriaceae bacterium]|nr:DUF4043 family protein [Neisseriaceae bacterium]
MTADDEKKLIHHDMATFAMHMKRNSILNRLVGDMPKGEAGAAQTLQRQTTAHLPIVRGVNLGVGKGDEMTFDLINPVKAKPIMGSDVAKGNEIGLSGSQSRLRIDQARFPLNIGDTMSDIRNPIQMRNIARPQALNLMNRYSDQSYLVHLAGARGFQDNIEWVIPLASDPDFDKIMVNKVKAPSKNRHFIASGDAVQSFASASSGGSLDVQSVDMLTMDTIDCMKSVIGSIPLPPPMVIFDGDKAATDKPLRVWMMSPAQYSQFAALPDFRKFQASAIARASLAKNHPIFLGEAGLWNGFLIVEMPKPIRFYSGDEIKYCANAGSEDESVIQVPDFGEDYAIDRSIILGGQALIEGFGKHHRSQTPIFWKKELDDYEDKESLLIGTIRGASKMRFNVNVSGDALNPQMEYIDYGVMAVDTVVKLNGVK